MRRVVVVAVALLALAAAPAARADVTVGSALPDVTGAASTCPTGCTLSPAVIPRSVHALTAPTDGVITRWRVRVGAMTSEMALQVLRRSGAGTTDPAVAVGRSATVTPPAGISEYTTQIPVVAGDTIGLECCQSSPANVVANTTDARTDRWEPPVGGMPLAPFANDANEEVLVNADIELDVDHDGHGDESQDNCPAIANPGQEDTNGDRVGNACDADGDGVPDASDACPTTPGSLANGCPAATPPAPRVNTPPVVRFRTPLSGTAVKAVQTIELDVADDAGNPTVTLFDDDGTICTLSAPPYSCTWRPTGADVGRATLLASAVDSDNRSTLGIVRVRVAKFEADLTRRVRGRRVTGRLVLPAAVERSLGCRGEVTVRRGRRTTTVALKRNCTYSTRLPRGRGRVRARFGGNPVVEPAT